MRPFHFVVIALVLSVAAPAVAAEVRGKVTSVKTDQREFAIGDAAGKSFTVTVNADARVTLNDKLSTLSDLKTDDEVTITYEKSGEKLAASVVRITRK